MKTDRPYVIAEVSANHQGDLGCALQLIDDAKFAGASAVKFQTFTPDSITVAPSKPYFIPKSSELWADMNLWELMDKAQTPKVWFRELFGHSRSLGLDAFSTPYDVNALNFLVGLGVDTVKISSFDVINLPFLRAVASVGLTTILSTGMAAISEIDIAVEILRDKVQKLILLKCTSSYPCSSSDLNLYGIETLKKRYDLEVGFSDHSTNNIGANVAVGLGASVFEKHIRLVGDNTSLDSGFSIDKYGFKEYVDSIKASHLCLGSKVLAPSKCEESSLWERPSVVALRDISRGEIFTLENIGVRRPSVGAPPSAFENLLGNCSTEPIKRGHGVFLHHCLEVDKS